MKNIWCVCVFTLVLLGCNNTNKNAVASDFIPQNSSIVLSINNLESLKSNLNNNHLLQELSKSEGYQKIDEKLQNLKLIKTDSPLLVCFSHDDQDSLQYTLITKLTDGIFLTDSISNIAVETLVSKKQSIQKTTHNNNVTFSAIKDSMFIASSSKNQLEATLNQKAPNPALLPILNTADSEKTLSILIDYSKTNISKAIFLNDSLNTIKFTDYLMIDTEINQDQLILNGIVKAKDSSSLINVFKNTIPQENAMAKITPSNSDRFMSFTFDEFSTFHSNLQKFSPRDSLNSTTLFDNIVEVGMMYQGNDNAVVLNSLDEIATKDALLNDQNVVETYRQISIYNFSESNLFTKTFTPFITFDEANYYAEIDNYFVFANTVNMLQSVITNYLNKSTFSERNYYQSTTEHLTDEASLLVVANAPSLERIIGNNLVGNLPIKIGAYKTSAIQFIYDSNFAHVNAVVQKNKSRGAENSVTEAYAIKLDDELLNAPQLVTNHLTKEKEICVQDVNNNLYLISNKGNVLWKKQLQGAILGDINQIDMYKNGRLQLAFATSNRVYVLDRKGRDVSPFPIKFNDPITQPLSVFDYDKKKKYRLLVTQGKQVIMYNEEGKIVQGFKFKSADNTINSQPQHFRIKGKDYLTIKTNSKLHILDRTGKTRINPKQAYNYSNQAIYLYKNKFTTTSKNGALIKIDTNGKTTSESINLAEKHEVVTTSKTLVTQNDNQLSIKHNTIDLDFGTYSAPRIFYLNDKIYVSVTDTQTQKVYLLDSNAKILSNFPVYGTSAIVLDNMDKDRHLEFITKGENNTVLIYQIN